MTISRGTWLLLVPGMIVPSSALLLEKVSNRDSTPEKVTVTIWAGWQGDEANAFRAVVNDYNRSQNRIFVNFLSISQERNKVMLATNGGLPPDIALLSESDLAAFADANALTDLTPFCVRDGVKREQYIPIYWDLLNYDGKQFAMPMTPVSTALHYNRKFLPPDVQTAEQAPKTIEDFDRLVDRISKKGKKGEIELAGFLPSEPGWWPWSWSYFFGGKLYDERTMKLTMNSRENVRAMEWVASYTKRFGLTQVQNFQSGFGNFSSPQNAFMAEKVGSVFQGVWMANFIQIYNPKIDWFATPMPTPADRPDLRGASVVGIDNVLVPKGARHVEEAWEFIRYQQGQGPMEKLCAGQAKHSPLAVVSEEFFRTHRNKSVRLFDALARTNNTISVPRIGIWPEINSEITNAMTEVNLGRKTAKEALDAAQKRLEPRVDKYLAYIGKKGMI